MGVLPLSDVISFSRSSRRLLRERERERDVRERGDISMRDVRDRDRDVMMRERDMERLSDPREAKRAKKRDGEFSSLPFSLIPY